MSNIHRPSGYKSLIDAYTEKKKELDPSQKHHYKITAQYDNLYHSITYYSDKTEDELIRGFILKIRYGQPCFVQDASNDPYNIINIAKANIIYIESLED